MITTLNFKTVWIDTVDFSAGQLVPAGTEIDFFTDRDAPAGVPVIKEMETAIIKWLLQSNGRNLLLESLDLPLNSYTEAAVGEPVIIEIAQPTWQGVDRMARVGICLDRKAELLSQPDPLTNRIEEWLHCRGYRYHRY